MTTADLDRPTPTDLDGHAADLRADAADLDAVLGALVARLTGVPGLELSVAYRNRRLRQLIGDVPFVNDLHRRGDAVRRLSATVDGTEYWIESDGGVARAGTTDRRTRPARTEAVDPATWAAGLVDAVAGHADHHHRTMDALRSLVHHRPA